MNNVGWWVPLIPWLGGLLGLSCLFFALRAGKRKRLMDNLPTSKTTGVFIGLVELKGTAEAERPLISYLAGQSCVHYQWRVEEHWSRSVTETETDSDGKTRTRTRQESVVLRRTARRAHGREQSVSGWSAVPWMIRANPSPTSSSRNTT